MKTIFHRLGLTSGNQRGFTLMEIVIASAIIGIISATATTGIYQMINSSVQANNRINAIGQVRSINYWVSHDAQMAQIVVDDDPATTGVTEFLTLSWTDWGSSQHRVAYTLEDIAGSGLKNLLRTHSIDGVTSEIGVIAQFIDPTNTSWYEDVDGVLIFTITVSVGSGSHLQNETRVFSIVPRPTC